MMRKWMIKIGNLFILLIVLGAMIGVNISQFRCAPCNRDYVFVDIFPQEELCCCQRVRIVRYRKRLYLLMKNVVRKKECLSSSYG